MKKMIAKVKTKKILVISLILIIISFILGILFPAILSIENKDLINTSLDSFFSSISKNKLNYVNALFSSLTNNIVINILIWLLGISIIGIPIIIVILIIKSFILGFSFSSIIMTYSFKGIILAFIYIIPLIINLFITLIVCYYAISFSIMLFNYLFRKKEYSRRVIVARYLKILGSSMVILILSSLVEVFLIPNILKIFI